MARELTERIAVAETDREPPTRNIRQSAYVSLHQTHLPKIDDVGIADFDQSVRTVPTTDRVRERNVCGETDPRLGLSRSGYSAAVAAVGVFPAVAA